MSKTSGLGDGLLVGPYDMSGDVQSLGTLSTPRTALDSTGIDKYAMERLYGQKDGSLSMTTFFNPGLEADAAHSVLSVLPRTDVQFGYQRGRLAGDPSFSMSGKQIDYNPTRNADGSLIFAVSAQANGYAADWGRLLTAGPGDAVTAPGDSTAVDFTDVSTLFGWQAYLWVLEFTGTSITVTLQDSADNASFTALTGGAFTAATALGTERIQGGRTATVRRYVGYAVAGTFTSATIAVAFTRNTAAASL